MKAKQTLKGPGLVPSAADGVIDPTRDTGTNRLQRRQILGRDLTLLDFVSAGQIAEELVFASKSSLDNGRRALTPRDHVEFAITSREVWRDSKIVNSVSNYLKLLFDYFLEHDIQYFSNQEL